MVRTRRSQWGIDRYARAASAQVYTTQTIGEAFRQRATRTEVNTWSDPSAIDG